MKWDNIKSLLNLAVVNKRLSRQQAHYLENKIRSFVYFTR